jgi:3-oxoacyl-[acyl-carrier-protein] synthase II
VTVLTGASSLVFAGKQPAEVDPSPFLKLRKSRKFMGLQDELAVVAAGRALAQAGLAATVLGERAGLFAAIGYIPFEHDDIAPVLEASLDGATFSMQRFAAGGYQKAHPLLTFRCLPNMPAYHVSVNFDVQGRYFVTYPGPAQLYLALEEARASLDAGEVDVALVVAVAHQRNFLVEHHFERADPPLAAQALCDAGACLVLEREEHALARGARPVARLRELELENASFDALSERLASDGVAQSRLGPAEPLLALAQALGEPGAFTHRLASSDGVSAKSDWEVLG